MRNKSRGKAADVTINRLLDRVTRLEAQVASLQSAQVAREPWPDDGFLNDDLKVWSSDPWPDYNADKRKGKTRAAKSHTHEAFPNPTVTVSDGNVPWNQNYRIKEIREQFE